jgi:adenylate cyclase
MRNPPLILFFDDRPENLDLLSERLEAHGYAVATAPDGPTGLAKAREIRPDLVLLDVMMPGMDGIAVVRQLKGDADLPFIPVILLTARSEARDIVRGLDAGGDDYLTKPLDFSALLARVRAMLRLKGLHDTVRAQAETVERQARELAAWNGRLEGRVAEQVAQIERMDRLRRFLPPQVADLLVNGAYDPLKSHRRDVTVVFADLRGFTAFAESAEPEEVMAVLRAYHAALGELITAHEGTLERFVGDGVLVVFNDPLPQADHTERALRLALAMRDRVARLAEGWRRQGHELGFGVGVARGEATLGSVGFERRLEYSVIGSVPNLASRLCDAAKAGQILISERVHEAAKTRIEARYVGKLTLKGFQRPVPAYELLGMRTSERKAARADAVAGWRPACRPQTAVLAKTHLGYPTQLQ